MLAMTLATRNLGPIPFRFRKIRLLAEEIDAHRKRVFAAHSDLTLTDLYNVLEKLRACHKGSYDGARNHLAERDMGHA